MSPASKLARAMKRRDRAVVLTLDALQEFVEDVDRPYAGDMKLQDEWPDLYITYQHAKGALAKLDAARRGLLGGAA